MVCVVVLLFSSFHQTKNGGGRSWETASARFSKDLWARPRVHRSGSVHGPSSCRSLGRSFVGASGRALEREGKRIVHETIEDRVGDRRVAQIRVPLIARELARDDR